LEDGGVTEQSVVLEEVLVETFVCLEGPAMELTLLVEFGLAWSCFECVEGAAVGPACLELTTAFTGAEPVLEESVPEGGTDGRGLDGCARADEPDEACSSGLRSCTTTTGAGLDFECTCAGGRLLVPAPISNLVIFETANRTGEGVVLRGKGGNWVLLATWLRLRGGSKFCISSSFNTLSYSCCGKTSKAGNKDTGVAGGLPLGRCEQSDSGSTLPVLVGTRDSGFLLLAPLPAPPKRPRRRGVFTTFLL